jgi:hypothetical protein
MRLLCRSFAAALWMSAGVFLAAAPAWAIPAHPRLIAPQAPLSGRPAHSASLVVHSAAASFRFGSRAAVEEAPIRALPLIAPQRVVAPRAPLRLLPVVLPRLGLATLLAPLGPDNCAGQRSTVLLAALPTNPFSPMVCEGRAMPAGYDRDVPTSLVPGHNKNALYGHSYAPRSFDGSADDGP